MYAIIITTLTIAPQQLKIHFYFFVL